MVATQQKEQLLMKSHESIRDEETRGYIPPNIRSDYSINQQQLSTYQLDDGETSNDVNSEYVQAQAH